MAGADFLKSDLLVLVDFYADWCGPCQQAKPVLEQLAADYAGKVKVVKVNVDENKSLAQKYQVFSLPTVILFKNGEEKRRLVGFEGYEGYRKLIDQNFKL
jgi:thioredoxin 1